MNNKYYSDIKVDDNRIESESISLTNPFIKVYMWMFISVLVTFITGYVCSLLFNIGSYVIAEILLVLMIISFVAEFILCISITKNASNVESVSKAKVQLIIYSILNGISFSVLFCLLDSSLLISCFGFVCIYFLVLAGVCALLKVNMEKLSKVALAGLITLLFSSILVGIFCLFVVPLIDDSISIGLIAGINILGLLVFTAITLFDMKKIKEIAYSNYNQEGYAIICAFNLYLDFINVFIYIIRLVLILSNGKRR